MFMNQFIEMTPTVKGRPRVRTSCPSCVVPGSCSKFQVAYDIQKEILKGIKIIVTQFKHIPHVIPK